MPDGASIILNASIVGRDQAPDGMDLQLQTDVSKRAYAAEPTRPLESGAGNDGYYARGVCSVAADDVISGGLNGAREQLEACVGIVGHNRI